MSNPVVYDMEEALSALDAGAEPTPASEPAAPSGGAEATPAPSPADSRVDALKEALRISEQARADMLRMGNGGAQQQVQQVQQPKWYSREEIGQLLNSENPEERLAAVEISTQQALAQAAQHLDARLAPLTSGGVGAAKAQVQAKYADEFALFGPQIEDLARNVPNQAALTTAEGWEHIIRYVRGDSENGQKLYEHRAQSRARQEQVENLGANFAPTPNGRQGQNFAMDDTTKQVAQNLIDAGIYKNMAEYVKDMKTFNNYFSG